MTALGAATPRRVARGLAASIFAAQFVALDLCFRGPRAFFIEPRLLLNAAASVALWHLAATLTARRPARALTALLAAVVLSGQLVVFRYYHMPIDGQILACAAHAWSDVRPIALDRKSVV